MDTDSDITILTFDLFAGTDNANQILRTPPPNTPPPYR